jgi:hypothetical protein
MLFPPLAKAVKKETVEKILMNFLNMLSGKELLLDAKGKLVK